jgi:gentisate 1,2-dioxygenase
MEKGKWKMIARHRDVELKPARSGGRRMELVSPRLGFPVRTMLTFYREIPPGGESGTHRHRNEAIIYIVKGKGYTMVEGERIDWEEGDILCIPVMAWHSNCNLDPKEPALFLATINRPLMESLDLFEIEDKEKIDYDYEIGKTIVTNK